MVASVWALWVANCGKTTSVAESSLRAQAMYETSVWIFGVPVSALDEPHHDAPAGAPRQIDDEVEHEGAALAISLHDEAHAVPSGELAVEAEFLQEIERQFQPVGLFGVDVEADFTFGSSSPITRDACARE